MRFWPTSLLKNTAQLEKCDIFMKNGSEVRDVLGNSRKPYRFPVGRDRKIRTALRTNQIVAIATGPSEKKINGNINSSFFPSLFFLFFYFQEYVKGNKFTKKQLVVGLLKKVNPCTITQNVYTILLLQHTSALSF